VVAQDMEISTLLVGLSRECLIRFHHLAVSVVEVVV
jgi:hypothetical protein